MQVHLSHIVLLHQERHFSSKLVNVPGNECRRDDPGELYRLDGPGLGDGDRLDGPGLGDGDRLERLEDGERLKGTGLGNGDRFDGPGVGVSDRLDGPALATANLMNPEAWIASPLMSVSTRTDLR